MRRRIWMSAIAGTALVWGTALPAVAQSADPSPQPAPALTISGTFLPDSPVASTSDNAVDDQGQPATHMVGNRPIIVRLDGGLVFCCSDTGFVVGATVAGQPRSVKNLEIEGSFGIGRFAGFSFLTFSIDGLYDFHMRGHQAMPFAGAGLGITHTDSVTNTAFEILGGIQLPVNGPHAVRFGVKFLFTTLTTTILFVNYSF